MSYIRFVITILVTIISLSINGQTQQGYVKTLGRPKAKGEALGDVIIKVKGEHNPVKSNGAGVFTIQFQNKKNGDAYALQEVRKAGYELNEPEVIGRQFAISDKVRNTIVMVSTAQLQADKQRIENNAYKVAEKNYKQKLVLLEKEKEDGIITVEKYQEQLQELQNRFEKYQSLIDGLAEHYAHTDYDELDEKEREINICIENGDLERADSLIETLFDPINVLKRNKEALAKINEQISQAEGIIDQANADMASVLKQQEKDAEHLYQLYTIALAQFDNETAAKYIEIRAELDTTNVVWQNQAALFLENNMGNNTKALKIFNRAVLHVKEQYGNNSYWESVLYNNLGVLHSSMGNYQTALEYENKSIRIRVDILGNNNVEIATNYNNIGDLYNRLREYEKSLNYHYKSLNIRLAILGEYNDDTASSYNNIGGVYGNIGNYDKELEYYKKALEIWKVILPQYHPSMAKCYNNLGSAYNDLKDYNKSLEYDSLALHIFLKIYGDNHPNIAMIYNNQGMTYSNMKDYYKAIDFYHRSLSILLNYYNDLLPQIGQSYENLASAYYNIQDMQKGMYYYQKAYEIKLNLYGPNSADVYGLLNNLSVALIKNGDYKLALEYQQKALEGQLKTLGDKHPDVGLSYNNIGVAYEKQQDRNKALFYYKKAIGIFIETYDLSNFYTQNTLRHMQECYQGMLKDSPNNNEIVKEYELFIRSYGDKINNNFNE